MTQTLTENTKQLPICRETYELDGVEREFYSYHTELGSAVAREVLSGKSYPPVRGIEDVGVIVDIGANIGASVLYFHRQFPAARILAFEPSPASWDLLVKNTEWMEQVERYKIAISNYSAAGELHLALQDSVMDSLIRNHASGDETVTVGVRDAATVMQIYGVDRIDILKVDAEGCEKQILSSLCEFLDEIKVIYVEFHSEEVRKFIDELLQPSHSLVAGTITHPHRGELTYVLRTMIPAAIDRDEILAEGDLE